MKKAVLKFTACCLAAGMTVTGIGTVAMADKSSSDTALAGLTTAAVIAETEAAEETEDAEPDEAGEAEAAEESANDSSVIGELAFAQCDEYINVRSEASTDSDPVGKVYNNGSVTIVGEEDGWYEIESGNVSGYVDAAYFATGDEAEAIAKDVGYNVATVYPEALVVRSEPNEDSDSVGRAYSSEQLEVVDYDGDWMKVVLDDGTYGYVSAYYVGYDTYYSTAESLEEEQERLDAEWQAYVEQQQAESEAAEQAYLEEGEIEEAVLYDDEAYEEAAAAESGYIDSYYGPIYEETYVEETYTEPSYEESYEESYTYTEPSYEETYTYEESYETYYDSSAADAAWQAYLDAQAAADEATLQGDEQLVYDTYYAAIAAYQAYLDVLNGAESTVETYVEETTVQPEQTYEEPTYEETYTYVEEDYSEPAYEETYVEETEAEVSYSSTGESIVNYAVQFVGNPYVYGGTSLTNGADCSGFTQSVFANFGISLPRTAAQQATGGTAVDLSNIQAGDLLFYDNGGGIGHVSIYMGNGQVVHASTSSTGIIISDYNYRTPVSARRYWS